MPDFLGAFIIIVAVGICLIALFNVLGVLFPARIESIRHAAETSPVRAFFLGLVNFLFFGALILGFLAMGENIHRIFLLPALLILSVVSLGLTFGVGGIIQLTGNRLQPDRSPIQRTTWGTTALYLACLTPFIGWFGVTAYLAWVGLGAFILSFFKREISKPD